MPSRPERRTLVYRCLDMQQDETVALKLYNKQMHPKRAVMESMLNLHHPNLVSLLGVGRWSGQFYEVMEYCAGGSLQGAPPLGEQQLRELLPAILRGLHFCHEAGIVHRDVKPANLLFRDQKRSELALADFGISSLLAAGEDSKKTQSFLRFTLDYCSPEQLRLRKVGQASDYYSLGVTLLHLLQGCSPFHGMDEDAVVDAHLQDAAPVPEDLSPEMNALVRGLLHHNPKLRWGIAEARAWLAGAPVPARDTGRGVSTIFAGNGAPYPAYPKARQPAALATCLSEFDVFEELRHGRLAMWVGLFDPDMAQRVAALEPRCYLEQEEGLLRLRHILNPELPLVVDTVVIDSPEGLAAAIQAGNKSFLWDLARQVVEGRVLAWFAATERGEAGARVLAALQNFTERYADRPHLAPYVVYWAIKQKASLPIGPGLRARKPEDLATILSQHPEQAERVETLLFGGYLLVWLEMVHPERRDEIDFVRDFMAMSLGKRSQGLQGLHWLFNPDTPLQVGKSAVTSPAELAAVLDSSRDARKLGCELLQNGTIRTWLRATGRLRDSSAFDLIANNENFSWATRLETILRLLDPLLVRPHIVVDAKELNFGEMLNGAKKTMELLVELKGRGHMWGRASIPNGGDDFLVQPAEFEGRDALLIVTATPPVYVSPGVEVKRSLSLDTNAGGCEILLRYCIRSDYGTFTIEEQPESFLTSLTKKIFKK